MGVDPQVHLSPAEEEYVEAIYRLTRAGGHAHTDDIASQVGVSAAAASGMLKRLAGREVVKYARYEGAELSTMGEREALRIVRRHRLTERLLTDILKIPWHDVHEQACRLEHAIMPAMEDGIEDALDNVATCPHGHPIPTREGLVANQEARPLNEVESGRRARIVRIAQEAPDFLRYLSSLGLLPQVEITVEAKAPFSGPVMVRVGRAHYALGREVAAAIMVAPV
jgi:DtxR family transcriptional regulator, Mn-dependent transcriptional regulator